MNIFVTVVFVFFPFRCGVCTLTGHECNFHSNILLHAVMETGWGYGFLCAVMETGWGYG